MNTHSSLVCPVEIKKKQLLALCSVISFPVTHNERGCGATHLSADVGWKTVTRHDWCRDTKIQKESNPVIPVPRYLIQIPK